MHIQALRAILVRLDEKNGHFLTSTKEGKKDTQTLPFFQRQLEQTETELYKREFPELAGAMGDLLNISKDVSPGARVYTWYLFEGVGVARYVAAYGDSTLPDVTFKGAEQTQPLRKVRSQYSWDIDDVRHAAFSGLFSVEAEGQEVARRAHAQQLHITMLWGRMDLGLPGFINHPNITVGIAADNGSGSTFWVDKTVEQIVADFRAVIDGTAELTNNVEKITDVRVALREFNLIKATRLGAGDGNDTILSHIRSIWPDVRIEPLIDLQAANSLGNLTSASMIGFVRDPRKADYVLAMPFTSLAPQAEGFKVRVPCESIQGGCRVRRPLSISRLDGIGAA